MLAAFLHSAPFARLGAKRTRRMQKGAGAFLHSVFRLHSKAQTGKKETSLNSKRNSGQKGNLFCFVLNQPAAWRIERCHIEPGFNASTRNAEPAIR
ncbi:MAG TPA: hypothetical protein VMA35_01275 [Candidatus Sulfopaludibacter sp.]|nr:hypothetical protein [Candidatus Sulfopaludibacter sp.]